jgi:undecaprenyl-diphosphatase
MQGAERHTMSQTEASKPWGDAAPDTIRNGVLIRTTGASTAALALVMTLRLSPDLFDRPVTRTIDGIERAWPTLDYIVRALDKFDMFQGGLLLAIAAAALAKARGPNERMTLFVGGFASAVAAALSRILQLFMPYSPRPMYDAGLSWTAPYDVDLHGLKDWSSFPSDHACLLFGIAFAVLAVNRRLGALAVGAAAILGLVRIYEGEHYLSDVLAGAFMAIFAVGITLQLFRLFERQLCALVGRHPGLFAAAAFVFFSQAATLFDNVRGFGAAVVKHLH